jgi:SAM-dependent methyltransferase
MKYVDADIRHWLADHPGTIDAYTTSRIEASYDRVASILHDCQPRGDGLALDMGCGAGFDSFALAGWFERVTAIDSRRRAIRHARRLQQSTGVTRVTFVRGDAVVIRTDPADLIWCNLMSHNVPSRRDLLTRTRDLLVDGGWLHYSEACEGYAPRELETAIARRDEREVRTRLQQIVNGLCGRPGFRFFIASTALHDLQRLGYQVTHTEHETWRSLRAVERVWARADSTRPQRHPIGDRDYGEVPDGLVEVRRIARAAVKSGKGMGVDKFTPGQLEEAATTLNTPLAPFLLLLLAIDVVPGFSLPPQLFPRGRSAFRVPALMNERRWREVERLFERFAALVPEDAGDSAT